MVGSENMGNSTCSASAIDTTAASLAVGVDQNAALLNVPDSSEGPKVDVDGNMKPSVQQKKRGRHSQYKHNDYLTEELKAEVDKYSPKEGDRDVESGRISEAGLQHLTKNCEIVFKKNREFRSVHQLCQFAALLGSKWYFEVSRGGYNVSCHYAPPPTDTYIQVSPGRQRKVKDSLKSLVQCPWQIKWSPLERGTGKDSSKIPIKITNGHFVHSCNPGIKSQAEAIKKSGAAFNFSAKKVVMGQIVDMLEAGAVPPSTL
jgi:hypothetical protein